MSQSGFDIIAPFYDQIARMIFGQSIQLSQSRFLNEIPADSKVLILGGGSGWLLTELFKRKPRQLYFVEASQKMLKLSEKRLADNGYVSNEYIKLIFDPEFLTKNQEQFDVIITPFFFDLFGEEKLKGIISNIHSALNMNGILLVSDFNAETCYAVWWKKALVKTMYSFFGLVAGLKTKTLYNYEKMLIGGGFDKRKSKNYFFEMIEAGLYFKV